MTVNSFPSPLAELSKPEERDFSEKFDVAGEMLGREG